MIRKSDPSIFFMDVIAVPPSKFRPIKSEAGQQSDHPHNVCLGGILQTNQAILKHAKEAVGKTADDITKNLQFGLKLQSYVNFFFDNKVGPSFFPLKFLQITNQKNC
jgi:DNA-directed RNA polymerase I subunit RPA1